MNVVNENASILGTILNIWREPECYKETEVLEIILDFALKTNRNRNGLLYSIKSQLEEIRIDNGLCPCCGNSLFDDSYEEDRGEYMGESCTQTIYIRKCSNSDCGWTTEEY